MRMDALLAGMAAAVSMAQPAAWLVPGPPLAREVAPREAWRSSARDAKWRDGKYRLHNNLWGTSNQELAVGRGVTMWAESHRRWGILPRYPEDLQHVMAYPGCWRGFHYAEESAPGSGFPVKVREIRKLRARWQMRVPETGRHWALWDIYLARESSGWKGKGWCNLMIFQNWRDPTGWIPNGLVNPGSFQPIDLGYHSAGAVKLRCRRTAAAWIEGPVITAILDRPLPDATFDLRELLRSLVRTGHVDGDWYLIGIEVGWEIHQAVDPLVTEFFAIDLDDEKALGRGG